MVLLAMIANSVVQTSTHAFHYAILFIDNPSNDSHNKVDSLIGKPYLTKILVFPDKLLLNRGVNEKSEWANEIQIFHNMMNVGNMVNCSLRVQIKFEFTK